MKEFMFKVVFIDKETNETRTLTQEYRAENRKEAERGIASYLMSNKTIGFVFDVQIFEEIEVSNKW